jgi:3-phosphoshikimate 1-carboxyvinyltransferase
MRRPMERVAAPLRRMGARITTQEGRPPVRIQGTPKLDGIEYTLPVASAQVKSALLLAGLAANGRTTVSEPAPSRDHTERMLRAFGVHLSQRDGVIELEGGQTLHGTTLTVPADFSSAAFFLVAGALAAEGALRLTHVGINPTRTGLLDLLQLMGAEIRVLPHPSRSGHNAEPVADIEVRRGPRLMSFRSSLSRPPPRTERRSYGARGSCG